MGYDEDLILTLPASELSDLVYVLDSLYSRIYIHHVLGIKVSLRELVQQLNVPFDFTVHDYYTICPQITLLEKASTAENLTWLNAMHASVADHHSVPVTYFRGARSMNGYSSMRIVSSVPRRMFDSVSRSMAWPNVPSWPRTSLSTLGRSFR